jgi:hypothetical protein
MRLLSSAAIASSMLFFAVNLTRADLDFARTTVNVGEVRCGAPLAHRFLFVNRGTTDVEITDVRTTCGCLTPTLGKKTLHPGEEGSLVLEVNTLTQASGPQDWSVQLCYRTDGQDREVRLQLVGKLVEEIRVEPPTLALYADQAMEQAVTVVDTRAEALSVKSVSVTSPSLQAAIGKSVKKVNGEWRIPIRVTFDPRAITDRTQETLIIFTDDPVYPELKVRITLVKEQHKQVTLSPGLVDIRVPAGQPLPSRIVLARASGDDAVDIESVIADDPAIRCTWAAGPDSNATLKISVDRAQIKGDHLFGKVQVKFRRPQEETLTLPVECLIEN